MEANRLMKLQMTDLYVGRSAHFILDVPDNVKVGHAWFHHQYICTFLHITILYNTIHSDIHTERILPHVQQLFCGQVTRLYVVAHECECMLI